MTEDGKIRRIFEIEWPKARVRLTSYELSLMRDALRNLLGEPLTNMVRVSTAQYLRFGVEKPCKDYKGEDDTRSDWGLMIGGSCHWRFEGPNGFKLGTDDFGPDKDLHDEHADDFYDRLGDDPLVIRSVEVLLNGTQIFALSDGYSLTIRMPEGVGRYGEPWRFMPPRDDFRGHLVLTEFGLKWGFRLIGPRNTRGTRLKWRRMSIKSRPGIRRKRRINRAERAKWLLTYGHLSH